MHLRETIRLIVSLQWFNIMIAFSPFLSFLFPFFFLFLPSFSFPFILFHTFILFLSFLFLFFFSQHYTSNPTHRVLISFPGGYRKILHIFPLRNDWYYRWIIKMIAVKNNFHPKKNIMIICLLYAIQISVHQNHLFLLIVIMQLLFSKKSIMKLLGYLEITRMFC